MTLSAVLYHRLSLATCPVILSPVLEVQEICLTMLSLLQGLTFFLTLCTLVSARQYTWTISGWTFNGNLPKANDREMRALTPRSNLEFGHFWAADCREAASDETLRNLPGTLLRQAVSGFYAASAHHAEIPGHFRATAPIQFANRGGKMHQFLVEIDYYDTQKGFWHVELASVSYVVCSNQSKLVHKRCD